MHPPPRKQEPLTLAQAYERIRRFGFLPSDELWNASQQRMARKSGGTVETIRKQR